MATTTVSATSSSIDQAVAAFLSRQDRASHPDGSFDEKSRWYPSDTEWQACCSLIRPPSAAWPYSLLVHCRTAEHVANLFGVDAKAVRRAARLARKAAAAY